MSHVDDRLVRDIGLWLAGESVDAAADRAVTALATRPEARGATGAALAVEDLVRDWYGGLPLPPLPPPAVARRRRRAIVSTWLVAVSAGIVVVALAGGDTRMLDRALDATASWLEAPPRSPTATSSWWHLRRHVGGM